MIFDLRYIARQECHPDSCYCSAFWKRNYISAFWGIGFIEWLDLWRFIFLDFWKEVFAHDRAKRDV
jgi:hypothetical protein